MMSAYIPMLLNQLSASSLSDNPNPCTTGSRGATDALIHLDLPVRLGGGQHQRGGRYGHDSRFVHIVGTWWQHGRLVVEEVGAVGRVTLHELSMWALAAVSTAGPTVIALASAAAASLHGLVKAAATGATAMGPGDRALLQAFAVLGAPVFFVALLPLIQRLLRGRNNATSGTAAGIGRDGRSGVAERKQQQDQQQENDPPFVPADWHGVIHDRANGAARVEERTLAGAAKGRGGRAVTAAEAVGRMLTHRVRGVLLSHKGR